MSVKLGVCEWSLPLPGPYNCKMIAEFGLSGFLIDIGTYDRGYQLSNKTTQKEYLDAAKQWGIEFPAMAVNDLNFYGMTSQNGTENKEIAKMAIKKAIDAANAMQIPAIYLPSFTISDIKTENDFKLTVECISEACDYASDKSVIICTENALSAEENIKLNKTVDRKNFKLYFDTQNPYLAKGYYVPDMIRKLAPYIYQVHVKDGRDGDLSGALLGTGTTSYYESMAALKEIGYSGWLVIENYYPCKPLSNLNEDPYELLKEDIRILMKTVKDYFI